MPLLYNFYPESMANEKYEYPINDANNNIIQNADVLIVGGGPIGLITAWGMKKLNPELNVLVLEKYAEYQRKHSLLMDSKQLLKIIKSVMTPEQFAKIEEIAESENLSNDFMIALWKRLQEDAHIRTSELEQIFKEECTKVNVKIIQEEVGGFELVSDFMEDEEPDSSQIFIKDLGTCLFYQTALGSLIIPKSDLNLDKETELSSKILREIKADILRIAEENAHLDIRRRAAEQICRFNPKLVIGADGTHSIMNRQFFAKNNQLKHPIDYALQLRFEINGARRANGANKLVLLQKMGRFNRVASEHVGHDSAHQTTPITVQLILTAEEFAALKQFTSKKPHYLFRNEAPGLASNIPPSVNKFINAYLETHNHQLAEGMSIDFDSIRISANELPATQVKEAVNIDDPYLDFALIGDAALGLSYFKGLNAGLNAVAEFLKKMRRSIQNNFENKDETKEDLLSYQHWYKPFSDQKVAKVKTYSKLRVRPGMKFFKFAKLFNGGTAHTPDEQDEFYTKLLLTHQNPYPHRSYNPQVFFAQWDYISPQWTFSRVSKYFADYTKPYKGFYQLKRDFLEPISAFSNLGLGLVRLVLGIVSLNLGRVLDGGARLFRGSLQLLTLPFTWTVKPLTRTSLTVVQWVNSYAKVRWIDAILRAERAIEETGGVKKLLKLGEEKLKAYPENPEENSPYSYEILALCFDLHRKLEKAQGRNQTVTIDRDTELQLIKQMACSPESINRDVFQGYFGLFQDKKLSEARILNESVIVALGA